MGLINSLLNKFMENRSYKNGKGIARAMLLFALAMREYHKAAAPTYSWIAGKALETRPKWKRINDSIFMHEPSRELIEITDDLSIKDVIHMVVDVETTYIFSSLPDWRVEELLQISNTAVNDYFSKQK